MGLRLRLSGDGCRERLLAFSDVFRESRFDPASKRTPPVLADETGGPGMRWKRDDRKASGMGQAAMTSRAS